MQVMHECVCMTLYKCEGVKLESNYMSECVYVCLNVFICQCV